MSSSLELLAGKAHSLLARTLPARAAARILTDEELNPLGPLMISREMRRQESDQNLQNYNPGEGTIDPKNINQVAMFIFFGFLGACLVVGIIWFFFWAKNGGFTYHDNDWEDYVSTVLRRKGPNGTVLSNATKSTDLGGGSIYHDYYGDNRTEMTENTGLSGSTISGITAGASDLPARQERKRKIEKRKREKKAAKERAMNAGEDTVLMEQEAEAEAFANLRQYRSERPARVGGMNRQADGSEWEGSTIPTESAVSASLLDNQQPTPTNSPQKKKAPGIRKVYSTADRNRRTEEENLKAETRALHRQNRAAALRGGASDVSASTDAGDSTTTTSTASEGLRRSYTYQRSGAPRSKSKRRPRSEMAQTQISSISEESRTTPASPGPASSHWVPPSEISSSGPTSSTISGTTAQTDSSTGTKSYYHPIPELRATRAPQPDPAPPTREPSRRRRESRDESSRRRTSQSRPRTQEEERAAREERRKSRGYRRTRQSDHDDVD
ncbi:hypothetical protein HOO65_040540 [Ceratocystis lukuohia]|uniref:Endosomal SPRY domain protein n=1 Tax=Ceratocystis lukuohia TaxID=2019550 RepID=A0ABR4MIT7_9PEZI